MFVRVQLRGVAPNYDPLVQKIGLNEIPFPTWNLIAVNPVTARAIVEIPDADFEPAQAGENPVYVNVPQVGNVLITLDPAHRARLLQRIRERYKERAANYQVQEA